MYGICINSSLRPFSPILSFHFIYKNLVLFYFRIILLTHCEHTHLLYIRSQYQIFKMGYGFQLPCDIKQLLDFKLLFRGLNVDLLWLD